MKPGLLRHVSATRAWLALVMLLCVAVLIWDACHSYLEQRQQTAERLGALARVIEARTELTFQSLDLLLMESANEFPSRKMPGDPDYLRFLKGRSFIFTDALTLSVVSPDGIIMHSSNPALVGTPVGQRGYLDYFRAHPEDNRLYISEPATSVTNRAIIFNARAVHGPDGKLAAVVVTGINPSLLGSLLSAALPSESSGAAAVLNRDGVILARQPDLSGGAAGVSMAQSDFLRAHQASGKLMTVHYSDGGTGPDGEDRFLVLRTTNQFNLYVSVSVAAHELWAPVVSTVITDLVFLAIVAIVALALARFLSGRERGRTQAQAQLAKARDYYMRLLDHLPLLIWRTDADGRLDYVNATLAAFVGGSGDDGLTPFIHPDDSKTVAAAASRRSGREEPVEQEYRLRRADGQYRWMHEIATPFPDQDGAFAGHLAVCTDITEPRQAQDKLTQSNAELEQFAYVTSHDLREPLRMISSYMGLIERRLGADAQPELREFLAFAKDGATRMDKLILDLLQFSRIGRMSAPKARTDLHDSVATALQHLGLALEESGAQVCVGMLPELVAAPDDMVRLFQNLIGNAIKYRQDGVPPRITVAAVRDAGHWRFSVTDNGIGLDPEYFERIFRIFQRLHGRDEHGGGSGIGLSICKKVVEYHGGRIWVESPGANQGSTFFFSLPG